MKPLDAEDREMACKSQTQDPILLPYKGQKGYWSQVCPAKLGEETAFFANNQRKTNKS